MATIFIITFVLLQGEASLAQGFIAKKWPVFESPGALQSLQALMFQARDTWLEIEMKIHYKEREVSWWTELRVTGPQGHKAYDTS